MRKIVHPKITVGRVREGMFASTDKAGLCGAFFINAPSGEQLRIIATTADIKPEITMGWEHVSVSTRTRCPTWDEMNFVKMLFWSDEETVIQIHPPKSQYVNVHPYCLHLWRDINNDIVLPPKGLIG